MVWPVYSALLTMVFVALSIRTLRLRRRLRIPVGDGGNITMLRAIRAHGNFAENAPFGLLLIFACESSGASRILVHALGLILLVGRLHALGVSKSAETFGFRVAGMALTFTCYLVAAAYLLWRAVTVSA